MVNFIDFLSKTTSTDTLSLLTNYKDLQLKISAFESSLSSSKSNWLSNLLLSSSFASSPPPPLSSPPPLPSISPSIPISSTPFSFLKELFGDGFIPIHKDAQKYVMVPKELLLEERLVMNEEERKMVSDAVELFEGVEKKKVL